MIFGFPRATDLKRSEATDRVSCLSGLTINGGYVSAGLKEGQPMSKSPTTSELHNPHAGEILLSEFLQPPI